jgi:hypothetical protein
MNFKRSFQLLPALILFLGVETVRAVDYVQCEAMRTVFVRLDIQRKEAVKAAKYAACKDLEASGVPIGKYVQCMDGKPTDIQPDPTKWPQKVESDYIKQMDRVLSDMKKAKCVIN